MVYFSGHELDDVDVIRTKTHDESEEDEQNDGIGPVIPPRAPAYRALLSRVSQFEVDLGVAAHDSGKWAAEGHGTGQKQEIRSEAGALEVEVLHAGSSSLMLVQHAAEQQRSYLQRDQSPDQAADPADNLYAPQTLQPVWMHHGKVSVQADAGHEGNAWWEYNGNDTQLRLIVFTLPAALWNILFCC